MKWVSSVVQTQVVEVGEDSLQTTDGVTVVQPYSSCRPAGIAGRMSPGRDTRERRAGCVSGQVFLGPPRMYRQLEELQHDLAVVQDVSLLVRTLRGTYQVTLLCPTRPTRQNLMTKCWTRVLARAPTVPSLPKESEQHRLRGLVFGSPEADPSEGGGNPECQQVSPTSGCPRLYRQVGQHVQLDRTSLCGIR